MVAYKGKTKSSTLGRDKHARPKYTYKERSIEDVRRRATKQGGKFDSIFKGNVDMFKVTAGDHTVRILPPTWEGQNHYSYEVWTHRLARGQYLCLNRMQKKPCPICKLVSKMEFAGEKEEAKQLVAKQAYVCWVIDRDDKGTMPKLWLMGWTLDRDLAATTEDKKRGQPIWIDHPDAGFDVSFRRVGTGQTDTKYFGWVIDREPTPIFDDQKDQDEVMEYIISNPVDSMLVYKTADELEALISGEAEEPDEDDAERDNDAEAEEEEREARQSARGVRRGKARDEEEEQEEDDDEEEDEGGGDDEEADADEEGGEEDDEEGDDDEEEAPPPRKPRREPDRISAKKGNGRRAADDDDDDDDDKPVERVRRSGGGVERRVRR